MQRIKLRTEESGENLSAAYAPPKWSETAEEEEGLGIANYYDKSIQISQWMDQHDVYTKLQQKQIGKVVAGGGGYFYCIRCVCFFFLYLMLILE